MYKMLRKLRKTLFVVIAVAIMYIVEFVKHFKLLFGISKMKNLKGKKVLITGGNSGIGKELAKQFLEKGAKVIIWGRTKTKLEGVVKEFQEKYGEEFVDGYTVDVSNFDEIREAAGCVKEKHGFISFVVNNAGVVNFGLLDGKKLEEKNKRVVELAKKRKAKGVGYYDLIKAWNETPLPLTEEEMEKYFRINLGSHYVLYKEFLPAMCEKNEGHLICISSISGLTSHFSDPLYSMTKFGAIGFTLSAAKTQRLMGRNIDYTICCPGWVRTPLVKKLLEMGMNIDMMEVEDVCKILLNGILCNERIVSTPRWKKHYVYLQRSLGLEVKF